MRSSQAKKTVWKKIPGTSQEGTASVTETSNPLVTSPVYNTEIPMRRNASGSLDYTYYANRARLIRSQSAGLFVKSIASYMVILGGILIAVI